MHRLVHRIRRGDQEAFAGLCSALTAEVHELVRVGVRDPRQVDLVVSSTFVEVWRLARFHGEPDGDVRAWVCAVADRRMGQWLRSGPDGTIGDVEATGAHGWWRF